MRAQQIAKSLRSARLKLGATQKEMAERVGVSPRLWAEVERGERPNVSLETALRMLDSVGVQLRIGHAPLPELTEEEERRARAAHRRATWTGRQVALTDEHDPPADRDPVRRLKGVSAVSAAAYAFAGASVIASAVHEPSVRPHTPSNAHSKQRRRP